MKNRDLAEKIYEDLNKRGAGIGNASIGIIKKTLDEQLRLHIVSQQRELLLAFAEYMDSENDIFVPSWAVDNYLNSK